MSTPDANTQQTAPDLHPNALTALETLCRADVATSLHLYRETLLRSLSDKAKPFATTMRAQLAVARRDALDALDLHEHLSNLLGDP